jgi:hypothetical protein
VVRGRETALEAGGEVLGGKTKFRPARHVIGRIGTEIETRRTGVAREGRPAGKKKALRFFQEKHILGLYLSFLVSTMNIPWTGYVNMKYIVSITRSHLEINYYNFPRSSAKGCRPLLIKRTSSFFMYYLSKLI